MKNEKFRMRNEKMKNEKWKMVNGKMKKSKMKRKLVCWVWSCGRSVTLNGLFWFTGYFSLFWGSRSTTVRTVTRKSRERRRTDTLKETSRRHGSPVSVLCRTVWSSTVIASTRASCAGRHASARTARIPRTRRKNGPPPWPLRWSATPPRFCRKSPRSQRRAAPPTGAMWGAAIAGKSECLKNYCECYLVRGVVPMV